MMKGMVNEEWRYCIKSILGNKEIRNHEVISSIIGCPHEPSEHERHSHPVRSLIEIEREWILHLLGENTC
jgi:hypothetical protein